MHACMHAYACKKSESERESNGDTLALITWLSFSILERLPLLLHWVPNPQTLALSILVYNGGANSLVEFLK
jgi:hypothetical protein